MTRPLDWSPLAAADPVPGDPGVVDAEALHLRDLAVEMRTQIAQLRTVGQDPVLVGRSADALRAAATDLAGRLEAAVGRYEQVHAALRPWARTLDDVQAESLRILERARAAESVAVRLDALPPAQPVIPGQLDEGLRRSVAREGAEADLAAERDRLDRLLEDLRAAARRCAEQITVAVDDEAEDSLWDDIVEFVVGAEDTPPDPALVAAWWRSLPEAQRQALLRDRPELVGRLDGLPGAVRSQANMEVLAREKARLEARLAELRLEAQQDRDGPGGSPPDPEIAVIRDKLASVTAITGVMARGGRQLLSIDTSGRRVKAAVATGDVDTASHLGVFTPGLDSEVTDSLARYDDQMDNLRRQSDRMLLARSGGSTAVVTWIGYEAPQPTETLDPGHSVAAPFAARNAAPDLAAFYTGLSAARPDADVTAIGHSYGSTTTGYALQEPAVDVDRAVVFGSPGLGTSERADLGVPELYVLEARNDPVADLGAFGTDPNRLEGVTTLSTAETAGPGGRLHESTGHSAYTAQDSTSQHNLARVLSGTTEQVIRGDDSGFGDVAGPILRSPIR